jgi:hypothetical protein
LSARFSTDAVVRGDAATAFRTTGRAEADRAVAFAICGGIAEKNGKAK